MIRCKLIPTYRLTGLLAGVLLSSGLASVHANSFDVRFQQVEDRGEQAYQSGDYQQAEAHWQEGLLAAREQKSDSAIAYSLVGLARVDERIGEFKRSVLRADEAATIARRLGDNALEAIALDVLGLGYRRLADYPNALSSAQRALEIARRLGDERLQASTQRNIGAVHQGRGDFDKAAWCYESSLATARSIGNKSEEAKSLNNLGGLYRKRADYQRALDYYEKSLAIRRKLGDQTGEGRVLGNLCLAYQRLNEYEQALDYCRDSLAIARKLSDQALEANNLNSIGAIYRAMGDFPQALTFYQQSLALKQRTGDRAGVGRSKSNVAEIHWRLGQYDKAADYFQQALEVSKSIGDPSGESATGLNLGGLYLDRHHYQSARDHFQRVLALQAELGQPEVLWRVYDGLSRVDAGLDRPGAAIMFGKKAVNSIQRMRKASSQLEKNLRQSFLRDKEEVYRALADLLIEKGRIPEAEQVLTMLKEEELYDFIRRGADSSDPRKTLTIPPTNPAERDFDALYGRFRDDLASLGREYRTLWQIRNLTDAEQARLETLEAELDGAGAALIDIIKALTTQFKAQSGDEAVAFGQKELYWLRKQQSTLAELGHGAALISTVVTPARLHLILTTPDGQIARQSKVSSDELNALIARFRQALTDRSSDIETDLLPLAQRLHAILVDPIAEDLRQAGSETLMWSLDGALRYIPLGALHDGTAWLIERHPLVVYTAAAKDNLRSDTNPAWRVAGFGVSKRHVGFAPLAAVPAELDGIIIQHEKDPDGVISGEMHLDEAFDEPRLKGVIRAGFPVLHIASHFRLNPGDNSASYLLLGDGNPLTLGDFEHKEAYRLERVDQLTLSACDTAMGNPKRAGSGAEVESFAALSQVRGAKAVLATLWPVADKSTGELMQIFYDRRGALRRLTKVEALRQAQLTLMGSGHATADSEARGELRIQEAQTAPGSSANTYAHPYFWAPFILMGNWL